MLLALSRIQMFVLACTLLGAAALLLQLDELGTLWSRTIEFAIAMQRHLQLDLAEAMHAIRAGTATALGSLIGLGFLYGVFHAVGPGHGKFVITTYLATHENRLVYGIALSFLASLLQGTTAIILVGSVAWTIGRATREIHQVAILLEIASYGLVVLLGLYLIWGSARRLYLRTTSHGSGPKEHGYHRHADSGCCHAHGPSADGLAAEPSVREFVMTLLSVGLRPCSGSILVLIVAAGTGHALAGMATVAAISIGTGITVSGLAVLANRARRMAVFLAAQFGSEGSKIAGLFDAAALLGGILILLSGVTLIKAAQAIAQHPLF